MRWRLCAAMGGRISRRKGVSRYQSGPTRAGVSIIAASGLPQSQAGGMGAFSRPVDVTRTKFSAK